MHERAQSKPAEVELLNIWQLKSTAIPIWRHGQLGFQGICEPAVLRPHVPFGLSSVKDPAHSVAEFREQLLLLGRRLSMGEIDNAHELAFATWWRIALPYRTPVRRYLCLISHHIIPSTVTAYYLAGL
jgi:hypothetical protein